MMERNETLEILEIGDPRLRQRAEYVNDIKQARELCRKMVSTLRHVKGDGLAAPQVGKSIRTFVVETKKTELFPNRQESPLYTIINPKIIKVSKEKEYDWESCFSVPGLIGLVERHKSILLRYITIDGEQREEKFEGYPARVIQHEYDHLCGIIYLDKLKTKNHLYTAENWIKYALKK